MLVFSRLILRVASTLFSVVLAERVARPHMVLKLSPAKIWRHGDFSPDLVNGVVEHLVERDGLLHDLPLFFRGDEGDGGLTPAVIAGRTAGRAVVRSSCSCSGRDVILVLGLSLGVLDSALANRVSTDICVADRANVLYLIVRESASERYSKRR